MNERQIINIRIEDIIPNRFQPRLTFDENTLKELASSIKTYGIIEPLILRQLGNKYEIIAGERRYKASQIAGLTEVPAIIMNTDDKTSAELAVVENVQRKELSVLEEALSYKKLLDMGQITQEQLALRMGKSQSAIANKLRLLNLAPEVQQALLKNSISERHARSLLQIKDISKQIEVLNKIISERMNVKATDDYIKTITAPNTLLVNSNVTDPIFVNENIANTDIVNLNDLNNISLRNNLENRLQKEEINKMNNENQFQQPSISQQPTQPTQNRFFPSLEDQPVNMNNNQNIGFNNYTIPQTSVMEQNNILSTQPTQPIAVEPVNNIPVSNPNLIMEQPVQNDIIEQPIITISPVNSISQPFGSEQQVNLGNNQQPINIFESPNPMMGNQNINMQITNTEPVEQIPNIESPIEVAPPMPTVAPTRINEAIGMVRMAVNNLENNNFRVDVREADLDNQYQIILTIEK